MSFVISEIDCDAAMTIEMNLLMVRSEIEHVDRGLRGIQLATTLSNGPLARNPVNRDGRPALPMFARNVDEQRVFIVLHADSMQRVAFLLETADRATAGDAPHERCPAH